jgi:hypothetical protein
LLFLHGIRASVVTVAFATAWLAAGAARSDGPVVGWGSNIYGETTPPPSVDGTAGAAATAIAAGGYHSCSIQAGTGKVVCWGYNGDGQAIPPASVDGTTTGTASAIAAGGNYTLAIAVPEPGELLLGLAAIGALACMRRHSGVSRPAPRA